MELFQSIPSNLACLASPDWTKITFKLFDDPRKRHAMQVSKATSMGDVISTIQLHMSETYQKPESIAGLAKPVGFTNSTLELIRASEALSMSAQQFFETYGGEIVVLYSTDPVFGNSYCYGEAVPGET